jgi:hypothetical protein
MKPASFDMLRYSGCGRQQRSRLHSGVWLPSHSDYLRRLVDKTQKGK